MPVDSIPIDQNLVSSVDFAELVAREQPGLLLLARRLVWDREEARDLVQAALADAYEQRRALRDPVAAPSWLRRILVHRAINLLRRRRLWRSFQALFHWEAELAPPPDLALGRQQQLAQLTGALAKLPARQATAFTLRYLQGLGLDEIAEAMGIDRGTVRIHLQRALRKLRADSALQGDAS